MTLSSPSKREKSRTNGVPYSLSLSSIVGVYLASRFSVEGPSSHHACDNIIDSVSILFQRFLLGCSGQLPEFLGINILSHHQ